uniref:PH domain-containing protein n=1 Tax=Scleropages formosus TaxID=113540 RepID=A0A8C9RBQ1_SCLFO
MCIGHFPSLPSLQPDQLNFKKGWLSKLFDGGVWKKRWFVLTDRSLRWYRDTVAEETGDLDGEVDLSTCCDVTEFPVLRNYGFQIHTKDGTVTLSAVTSGIRRHWIQAMLKNVKTITAPDVTRSKAELQTQMDNQNGTEQRRRRSRIRDRRLEGRYRTFDWAEFRRELLPQKLPRPPEKARDTVDRKALPTPATTMPKEEGANRGGCGLEKDPPREEGLSSPPRLQQETNLPCQQEEIKPPEDERQVTNSAKTPMSLCEVLLPGSQCLAWTLSAASAAPLTLALCLCVYVRAPACQVTCQLGFAAMEDAHQKAMEELHKRHQTETAKLQEERDRLLAEETAATIAGNVPLLSQACALLIIAAMRDLTANVCPAPTAIEAMKKAHHEELKKSVHRELDVLSQQYSHKCLESTHLAQALEAERLALRRCQRENRELNAHNQELNRQLREEISRIRSGPPAIGAGPSGTRSSERYEMEVLLHVKEAELQCLKQELCSLQDELQSAERGAGDKHSSQLSVTKAQEEHLAAVMEARGRTSTLKEGLTPQECTRLFEDADSRKI